MRDIQGDFAVSIGSYEFLRESYVHRRFLNVLNILERNYELIQQFGPDFVNSESLTEWKILDPQRLEEFIKKKSINYILRRLE